MTGKRPGEVNHVETTELAAVTMSWLVGKATDKEQQEGYMRNWLDNNNQFMFMVIMTIIILAGLIWMFASFGPMAD